MGRDVATIAAELEAVNKVIVDLQQALDSAQIQKKKLIKEQQTAVAAAERKKQLQQQEAAAARQQQQSSSSSSKEEEEPLQARIAELQRQLQEVEEAKRQAEQQQQQQQQRSPGDDEVEIIEEIIEEIVESDEEIVEEEVEEVVQKKKPGWFGRGKKENAPASPARQQKQPASSSSSQSPNPTTSPKPPTPAASTAGSVAARSPDSYKKQHKWEKPGWAQEVDDNDDRAVDNDPISNPLLKKKQDGYQRKVFAKELDFERGKHVRHQDKAPDPRLTWIVVRINDTGVPGKIVMNLYGKSVLNLVDKFLDLKDQAIQREGNSLTIDADPKFHIVTSSAKGLDNKPDVYGVVKEGHEIVNKLLAADSNATFSVKQAHIFPVKKSKGGL